MGSEERKFLQHAELKPKYQTLEYKLEKGVLEVTIARQKQLNAFNMTMFVEFYQLFRAINYSLQDIRCVVLRAHGKHFSVGLDRLLKSERNRHQYVR